MTWHIKGMLERLDSIHPTGQKHLGVAERGILGLVNPDKLKRILSRMLDETESFGSHGIRSVWRCHKDHRTSLCWRP
jgi:hypothetical protein